MTEQSLSDNNKNSVLPIYQERFELVRSLLSRSPENRQERAKEALNTIYPHAPDKMIDTAIFHLYVDGIGAVFDWLAGAELLLRDGDDSKIDPYHVLYHLYNWLQFQTLMPIGSSDILETLQALKGAIADRDDREIECCISDLEKRFQDQQTPPDFWIE